jgi:hypothetical protein
MMSNANESPDRCGFQGREKEMTLFCRLNGAKIAVKKPRHLSLKVTENWPIACRESQKQAAQKHFLIKPV